MPVYTRTAADGSKSYQVKIRRKGAAPLSKTFQRKTDALQWEKLTEAQLIQDMHFPFAKAQKLTVNDLVEKYMLSLRMTNPRRWDEIAGYIAFWKKELGHYILAHLTSEHVVSARNKLMQREGRRKDEEGERVLLSPSTTNRYMSALHAAMQHGVTPLKWLRDNPVADVKKLKEPEGRTRFLAPEEIDLLIHECRVSRNPHLFTLVLLGISTGARKSELRTLKWSQITDDDQLAMLKKTKSNNGRSCQLTGLIQARLKAMREARGSSNFLFPSPNNENRPVDFTTAWKEALKRSGVPDFRFHDLRHTCGSYLAMNGAGEVTIASVLGHKDLQMVRR